MSPAELEQCRRDGALLYAIVSDKVKLKASGETWQGLCPFHPDKTPSFTVYRNGGFHCFGCQAHGTSFDFVMKTEKVDFPAAVERIARLKDIKPPPAKPKTNGHAETEWLPMVPPPPGTRLPTVDELPCNMLHVYRDADGDVLCYVRRYEAKAGGKKLFLPLTYGKLLDKRTGRWVTGWHERGPAAPKPLYGLDFLALAGRSSRILLCEGEKSAEAARRMFPTAVCLSWMGGTNGDGAADLTPLAGREVVLWGDADEVGQACVARLAKRLPGARMVDVEGLPKGFDAADLEAAGEADPAGWLEARLREPTPEEAPEAPDVDEEVAFNWAEITEISEIRPRQWAYGRFLLFGSAACIGAMDGAGKGMVAVVMALAMITGKPLLGEPVWRTGPVAIITYEDDQEEWRRRFAAACLHHGLDYKTVMKSVGFLSKPGGRVTLAQRSKDGLAFPDTARIVHHLKAIGAVMLIIDPFNNAHEMDDGNNNVAIAAVALQVTTIAREANVAALVLHHLRKGSTGSIDDLMGATALRANFRACRILVTMTAIEAKALGVVDAWRYLRVAGSKENYAPPLDKAMWFEKVSIPLGNPAGIYIFGDEVGAVTTWTPPKLFEGVTNTVLRKVFDAIAASPHSPSKQVRVIPWAGKPLKDLAGRTDAQASGAIDLWLNAKVLIPGEMFDRGRSRHAVNTVVPDMARVAEILSAEVGDE